MGNDMSVTTTNAVDSAVYIGVQRFLYSEARLLDDRRYSEWLSLFASDFNYSVWLATFQEMGASPAPYAIIDEDRVGLQSRVDQISNARLTRAENPPSLTRRLVTNIEVFEDTSADRVRSISSFLVHKSRPGTSAGLFYVGTREDLLLRENGWRILRRTVRLDQALVSEGSLTTLL